MNFSAKERYIKSTMNFNTQIKIYKKLMGGKRYIITWIDSRVKDTSSHGLIVD